MRAGETRPAGVVIALPPRFRGASTALQWSCLGYRAQHVSQMPCNTAVRNAKRLHASRVDERGSTCRHCRRTARDWRRPVPACRPLARAHAELRVRALENVVMAGSSSILRAPASSWAGTRAAAVCDPARPVPLLHVHGTADPLVPYAGGRGGDALLGPIGAPEPRSHPSCWRSACSRNTTVVATRVTPSWKAAPPHASNGPSARALHPSSCAACRAAGTPGPATGTCRARAWVLPRPAVFPRVTWCGSFCRASAPACRNLHGSLRDSDFRGPRRH